MYAYVSGFIVSNRLHAYVRISVNHSCVNTGDGKVAGFLQICLSMFFRGDIYLAIALAKSIMMQASWSYRYRPCLMLRRCLRQKLGYCFGGHGSEPAGWRETIQSDRVDWFRSRYHPACQAALVCPFTVFDQQSHLINLIDPLTWALRYWNR